MFGVISEYAIGVFRTCVHFKNCDYDFDTSLIISDIIEVNYGIDSDKILKGYMDFNLYYRKIGTTAQRSTYGIPSGFTYFDTTLSKPIWYNGTSWIDNAGATV